MNSERLTKKDSNYIDENGNQLTLYEIKKGLTSILDLSEMRTLYENAITKLGQLEDIEDELGIDLITLFKALKNGIYVKSYLDCYRVSKPIFDLLEQCLIDISESDHYSSNYEITKYYFKDFGKTWALTEEELL